jgi:hypothetical protein
MLTSNDLAYIDVNPLRVTHRVVRAISWIVVVIFAYFSMLVIVTNQLSSLPIFLFFLGLGILLLFLYGSTEVDSERIRYHAAVGSYEMYWEAVVRIEVDPYRTSMVFHGDHQRLVIPGTLFWSGLQKAAAKALLQQQIERYQITAREMPWAAYKLPKNTRVSS